eukprot:339901-Chlamydomonas_euryale.AAC.2
MRSKRPKCGRRRLFCADDVPGRGMQRVDACDAVGGRHRPQAQGGHHGGRLHAACWHDLPAVVVRAAAQRASVGTRRAAVPAGALPGETAHAYVLGFEGLGDAPCMCGRPRCGVTRVCVSERGGMGWDGMGLAHLAYVDGLPWQACAGMQVMEMEPVDGVCERGAKEVRRRGGGGWEQ